MGGQGPGGWVVPLHAVVLDAAGVEAGTRLLDLGCGSGLFARAAVRRGAVVTGIDLDPAAVARASAELPGARFDVGDARHPPPGPFDVAAAVQLLMHVPDPPAVLTAAARAAPVVVASVWGRDEECDVRVFGEALAPWVGARRAPAVTDPVRLRSLAERAGLHVVALDEVVCRFDYPDADALVRPVLASALGRGAVAGPAARPAVLRAAVLRAVEPYRTRDGGYVLRNLFRVLVGHRTG